MIPRYSRPEMVAIWQPATRFHIWFEIEAHAADAMAELGVIPKAAAKAIWRARRRLTMIPPLHGSMKSRRQPNTTSLRFSPL